jgi:hypothetical protein
MKMTTDEYQDCQPPGLDHRTFEYERNVTHSIVAMSGNKENEPISQHHSIKTVNIMDMLIH